jgi:magnesium transporter
MSVECALYEHGRRHAVELPLDQACEQAREPGHFVWIDLFQPTEEEFAATRDEFSLDPLAVEDALEAHQRPKLERYGDVLLLVLKTANWLEREEDIEFGEILAFAGQSFLITVRHGAATELIGLRDRLDAEEQHTKMGPMAALHALLDLVVDDYEPVIAGLSEDVDEVEAQIFTEGGGATKRIYALGRETLEFTRAVAPLIAPVERLATGSVSDVEESLQSYFRDVQDHLMRMNAQVDAMHELLGNLLQANLTHVTVRQNEDMRKISAWVAIAAVPTAIAGIYGMNFEHMPELRWHLGYPGVLVLMAIVCGFLWTRFKKAGWL